MEKYGSRSFLIILIAPSGGGKSTIAKRILEDFNRTTYSISYTTRKPRGKEQHGVDYFFISQQEFEEIAAQNGFLESALVHGYYYGTSRKFIEKKLAAGKHIVLDIDVQGARQVMQSGVDCVTVFILPPTISELEKRLRARGTDSEQVIALRLQNARREIAEVDNFDFLVINDDLEQAVQDVERIIKTEEMRICRKKKIIENFMEV
ncbi:MAG TPA: guanylate kinase [Candidatus Cloacimonas sp.]|jgi:guanylate kinase|nr:guanylate kinase [Candidatus Cloacimonas sp.]